MSTIHDVAEAAGVSISTVSRVMNQSTTVSKETCHRVMEAVRRLGYVPNVSAKQNPRKATKLIGVLFPDISNNIFGRIMQGINNVVTPLGYNLIICETNGMLEKEIHFLNVLKDKQVDGVIMANIHIPEDHMMWVRKKHIPIVYVCQDIPKFSMKVPCSSVNMDNKQALCDMVHFLYDMGHRNIAFIGGPNHLDMVRRRKHGYLEALRENRIPIDRDLVVCDRIDFDVARNATLRLLEKKDRPDAILAFNDIITYAAFDAIKEKGLRIPEDVAIIGFTDGDTAAFVTPKLSAIMDKAHEQGTTACDLLMRSINGDEKIYKKVVPMILKIRESSEKTT